MFKKVTPVKRKTPSESAPRENEVEGPKGLTDLELLCGENWKPADWPALDAVSQALGPDEANEVLPIPQPPALEAAGDEGDSDLPDLVTTSPAESSESQDPIMEMPGLERL